VDFRFHEGKKNMPFVETKVEKRSADSLKRSDFSLIDRDGKIALTVR